MSLYSRVRGIFRPSKRERIVVGGVDITYFRGKRTPTVPYELIEPFGYGPATITIPQSRPYLEAGAYGTGELAWVKTGKHVHLQRIDKTTGEKTTDYRGVVIAVKADGPQLVLQVGGILEGPAELRNEQVPVYRKVRDIGAHMFDAVENAGNYPGVHFEPRLGPTTGIEIPKTGGMTHLGWLQHLCTMAVHKDGRQWTCMPKEHGSSTFEMRLKDYTTVHATVYLDSSRAVGRLSDDASEQPNTGFGQGVTNEGMIYNGMVLPGVEPGDPPPYPGTLSLGSSGDSVQVLHWKLIRANFLDRQDASPLYDQDTVDAVEQLQDRANLPITGVVNKATWEALFDVGTLGFDISGARIMPLVQASSVRPYNYTGNGNLLGKNPAYNRDKLRVDRNYDFGVCDEKTARQWIRGQFARLNKKSWAGTITMNKRAALILGEHNPGDPKPTSGQVLSARDIPAGWNLWVPNFDGGTLVHVARCAVNGDTVTFDVDTHARDALELGEIIQRNRDSRRSPRRDWVAEQRGSTKIHDAVTPFTDKAGIVYTPVPCPANTWTGFWVFAGEAGTLSQLRALVQPASEYAMSVWGMKVPDKLLNRRVGDPFPVDKDGETVWSQESLQDFFEQNLLLYAAGDDEQPCGYWPRKHTNRLGKTTSAPLNGKWRDHESIGYITNHQYPALWVAIRPRKDTVVQRGRMLYTQIQAAL